MEERAELGRPFKQKPGLSKLGVPRTMSAHWLGCDSLSLAGLFVGKRRVVGGGNLFNSSWVV